MMKKYSKNSLCNYNEKQHYIFQRNPVHTREHSNVYDQNDSSFENMKILVEEITEENLKIWCNTNLKNRMQASLSAL